MSLELRDLALGFGGRLARRPGHPTLAGLSVRVANGERVAVAGRPGFGGTTLARLVAGILSPSAGSIRLNDVDITDDPLALRPVGLVPIGGGLLPHLTVAGNITYGLHLRKVPDVVIRHRLAEVAERLELLPSLPMRPHEVSPGQRIRTSLARVMARRAQALVLDATAGAEGLGQLTTLVERAWPDKSMPVLVCTSDPAVAGHAERVVVVERGRTGPSGRLDELRAAPRDLTTARVVRQGPAVELGGTVRNGSVDLGAVRLPAPAGLAEGTRVLAVAMNGAVDLQAPAPDIAAKVVSVRTVGAEVEMSVEPDRGPGTRWLVRSAASDKLRVGERLGVRIDERQLFVFDAETPGNQLLLSPASGGTTS